MNKRTFLKSLSAFGLVGVLPTRIFSKVADFPRKSTINGIPVEIVKFEHHVIRHLHTVRSNNLLDFVMDTGYSFDFDLEVKGRLFHNILDKVDVVCVDSQNGCTWEIHGEVAICKIDNNKTRLYLRGCTGRLNAHANYHRQAVQS